MRNRLDQFRRRAAYYLGRDPLPVTPQTGVLSLSFDDFPKSAWEVAGPILKDHGVRATYYVAGGLCDGSNIGKVQYSERDLQEVFEAGHEVGCHTYSHVSVLRLDTQGLADELDRNAAWVAERLDGHVMDQFAYPFGDASLGAKKQIGQRFAHSRGVRDGVNKGVSDRNNLLSFGLESRRLPHYDLEAMMAEASARKGWLIGYGHDVESDPTPYGCTPQDLERIILMARQAGLSVLPVSSAFAMMSAKSS